MGEGWISNYHWLKTGRKSQTAAEEIKGLLNHPCDVEGLPNTEAVIMCDLAVLTVPYSVHKEMLQSLFSQIQGKILIDVTVPLVPPRVSRVQMPAAGSAAQEAQQILGEGVQVVAAFQNIPMKN